MGFEILDLNFQFSIFVNNPFPPKVYQVGNIKPMHALQINYSSPTGCTSHVFFGPANTLRLLPDVHYFWILQGGIQNRYEVLKFAGSKTRIDFDWFAISDWQIEGVFTVLTQA